MSNRVALTSAIVKRILPAPPEEVFDAWLDERALAHFICPAPGCATAVSVDPTIGGSLRFLMTFPDHEIEVTGEFIALDRPDRISFTWRCSDTGDLESIVTAVFAPEPGGNTLMTITHSRQPGELVEKHRAGWQSVSAQLHSLVQRHSLERP
jgi:uncharacterized protein YndB with AHSA1/START domain